MKAPQPTSRPRPLDGMFVLDFSTLLPGPMATLLLAEAGAEVLKIERPGGEEMRGYAPTWAGGSVNFALLNRGKTCLELDLKDPAARDTLRPLLERADILVEQFRPGVMARLGLDYDAVSAINPRLIYCSITGYGQTGPRRDVAGHDLNYISETGLLALSSGDPARPVVPPALIADIAGGAYPAVLNILLAVQQRHGTGIGQHLDIAMTDNLFPFTYWALGAGLAGQGWPGNGTGLVTGGTARYRLYPTSDGGTVAVAAIEDKFWAVFCDLIALPPEHRDDAADGDAAIARVSAAIVSEPARVWKERFAGRDCCCSVVATLEEAVADPHFKARGLFSHAIAGPGGERIPALPVPVAPAFRAPADVPIDAPRLLGR